MVVSRQPLSKGEQNAKPVMRILVTKRSLSMNKDLAYQIALSLIPGIGCITAKTLVAYTGSAEQVFREKENALRAIPGIGTVLSKNISTAKVLSRAEKEIEFITNNKIQALFYLDEQYPVRLHSCDDAPIILYVKGNPELNAEKMISIVGTRHATEYGKEMVDSFVSGLSEKGHKISIVSGLAYGIDVRAHKSALGNGLPTIAVMGHGLETIYPSVHTSVAREMVDHQGGLVSDFMSYSSIDPKNFLRRNRIIAGLSDATIVVESARKGGALVTAEIASSYNRDIFAFPGRKGDLYSEGCNFLIKTNKAALLESVADLEYVMNWSSGGKPDAVQPRLFNDLAPEEKLIVDLLEKEGETAIDQICLKTGLAVNKISPTLLNLEFSGIVKVMPGKVYKLMKA
jgi:DNA processing protein